MLGIGRSVDISLACSDLAHLIEDFVNAAKMYGELIISEIPLPNDLKTIKPIENMGVAGGQKYMVNGILFKICVDEFSLR